MESKRLFEIINDGIEQAYSDLDLAMKRWDEAVGPGAVETEYGNVKFAHGKIVALERLKKEIKEELFK